MRRLHPAAAALFFRRWVILCLAPLLPVLFQWDWPALALALRQDAALLLALGLAAWLLLHGARWWLDEHKTLYLRWGFGPHAVRCIPLRAIAVVTLERGPLLQLTGAALVTVYPAGGEKPLTLCLTRQEARQLADQLLPLAQPDIRWRPAGAERWSAALLGANGLSSLALAALALRRSQSLPGAQDLALEQLDRLAALAARWMPAGLAWLLAAAALWYGLNLARAADHAARLETARAGDILWSRGGLWRQTECRLHLSQLSYAELRASPAGWLLHRRPLYLAAGTWRSALPLAAPRPVDHPRVEDLLPGFCLPPPVRPDLERRSHTFFRPAGMGLGICLVLALLSRRVMPALTAPLLLLTAACGLLLGGGLAGYLREGAWPRQGRLTACVQRGLRLHMIWLPRPALALEDRQNPWSTLAQRTNLTLRLPGRVRIRVRSIPIRDAEACLQLLEYE